MKYLKLFIFWSIFFSLYMITKNFNIDAEFKSVIASLLIAIVSRAIITERYESLLLKDEILRGIYDLTEWLQTHPNANYWSEKYPIVEKATENIGIFCNKKIVKNIYLLEEAITTRNRALISAINTEHIHAHLQEVLAKKTLANFFMREIIVKIFIEIPVQICDGVQNKLVGVFTNTDSKLLARPNQTI